MAEVFIIQNHDQTYLSKHGDWIDGSQANQLFRSHHKDEAINIKVEQSVRNPQLRLSIISGQLNEKGQLRFNQSAAGATIDSEAEVLFNNEQNLMADSEPPLTTNRDESTLSSSNLAADASSKTS